jgi:hypothetical protein
MQHKLIIAISITLFSFTYTATGQKLVNSPYSRFNIGTMEPTGSFRSLSMGGIETSSRGNSSVYFSNPASYSSLDTNSFVFDFGLDYSMNKISDGTSHYNSDDLNFDHLMMGFPIRKGWGVALGTVPISNGYYKIYNSVLKTDPGYNPLTGEYSSTHAGDGGYNNFFLGSGIMLGKNLSVGVNMTLLFGQVNRFYEINFIDVLHNFHNNSSERLHLGGVNFNYGIQYTVSLKNDYFLNAGVSLSSGKNYNSKYEYLSYKFTDFNSTARDTISYVADDSTKTFIPGTFRLGISVGKKDKFTVGIDFVSTKWSKSKIPGDNGYAADTKSFLFGAEYIPDKYSNYSLLKRVEYRIGGHIADNYLIINNNQLKEYGASFGIGFPMKRSLSKTNLYFDFTRKYGPANSNLFTENYYTLGFSLNLYDFWFLKRKYD